MAEIYLNFPVALLQNAFANISNVMNSVMWYAGYVHTLNLQFNSDESKMLAAGKYFGITWGNALHSFQEGEDIYNSLPPNLPMTGINKDVLFDFYKNHKTNDETAVLLAYLAIKSIIGMKPYSKCTNDYLIARMGGYSKIEDMPEPLPEPLQRYNTKRKLDNIKKKLQLNWNVNYYSYHTRGFYVSIDNKFTLDELVLEAEKRRKTTREKRLRQKKEDARKTALNKLSNDMDFKY
jgi:hypothetical protein